MVVLLRIVEVTHFILCVLLRLVVYCIEQINYSTNISERLEKVSWDMSGFMRGHK